MRRHLMTLGFFVQFLAGANSSNAEEEFTLLSDLTGSTPSPARLVERPLPNFEVISATTIKKSAGELRICRVHKPENPPGPATGRVQSKALKEQPFEKSVGSQEQPRDFRLQMLSARGYPNKRSLIQIARPNGESVQVWSNIDARMLYLLGYFQGPKSYFFILPAAYSVEHKAKEDIPKEFRSLIQGFRNQGAAYVNIDEKELTEHEIECLDGLHLLYQRHFVQLRRAAQQRSQDSSNEPQVQEEPKSRTVYFWEGEKRPLNDPQ